MGKWVGSENGRDSVSFLKVLESNRIEGKFLKEILKTWNTVTTCAIVHSEKS